jgi:hypothetical protein
MDKCKFHSDSFAHVRCKTCHIPLCDECKIPTDIGIYCSEECHQKGIEFANRVMPSSLDSSSFSFGKLIGGILIIAVLIALIGGGLQYLKIINIPFIADLLGSIGL